MSPVAPIAHLIGFALGVFGGFWLGGVVAPDLPSADTEPGVVVDEGQVTGAEPDSLYHAGPLAEAVTQTLDQLGAGAEVSSVKIEPSTLRAVDAEGAEGLPLESMPVEAPARMVTRIEDARAQAGVDGPISFNDFLSVTWTPGNPTASEWYILLDVSTAGPPTEFAASRDGTKVTVGAP
jgi:hypothetical protein